MYQVDLYSLIDTPPQPPSIVLLPASPIQFVASPTTATSWPNYPWVDGFSPFTVTSNSVLPILNSNEFHQQCQTQTPLNSQREFQQQCQTQTLLPPQFLQANDNDSCSNGFGTTKDEAQNGEDDLQIRRSCRKRKRTAFIEDLQFLGIFKNSPSVRVWADECGRYYYDCVCGRRKAVQDIKKIDKHLETHRNTNYGCDRCGKDFTSYFQLNAHKRIHKFPPKQLPPQQPRL